MNQAPHGAFIIAEIEQSSLDGKIQLERHNAIPRSSQRDCGQVKMVYYLYVM